jgi:hypothetical protein
MNKTQRANAIAKDGGFASYIYHCRSITNEVREVRNLKGLWSRMGIRVALNSFNANCFIAFSLFFKKPFAQ